MDWKRRCGENQKLDIHKTSKRIRDYFFFPTVAIKAQQHDKVELLKASLQKKK